jgi:CDP-glycerol glycerophosphotransferase (TagB/SpsB family)
MKYQAPFKFLFVTLQILFIPLWFMIGLFPRKKGHIVLGELMGEAIGENSTYLGDQLLQVKPDLNLVHIANTQALCLRHHKAGRMAYKKWSIKGIIATMHAEIVITSNSKRDVNRYFVNGATQVNLWHGSPIKKIMCDDHLHPPQSSELIKLLLPYRCGYSYDYSLCSGRVFILPLESAFKTNSEHLLFANSPKCTAQHNAKNLRETKKLSPYKNKWIILFAPTFRDYDYNYDPFAGSDIDILNRELKRLGIIIVIKSHFAALRKDYRQDCIIEYSQLFDDLQINLSFNTVDALITDYSGVYFDFLLTEKPVILAPFDKEKYLADGRQLYFDYSSLPCDIVIGDWVNFSDILESLKAKDTRESTKYMMKNSINEFVTYKDKSLAELLIEKFAL